MPKPAKSEPTLPGAIMALAEQFKRYNDANEPDKIEAGEAESFRASYEREAPGAKELHDFLTGTDKGAAVHLGRAQGKANGGSQKAPGPKKRSNGGGS
jgi:hypothetical protein